MAATVDNTTVAAPTFPPVQAAQASLQVMETTKPANARENWEQMIERDWAKILCPSTAVTKESRTSVADSRWFVDSLAMLDRSKRLVKVDDNWPEQAFTVAEYLVANFAAWPRSRRPDISLDPFNRPHFSAKGEGYYLHISIEDDCTLNWYAQSNGEEYFVEADDIQKGALSAELENLRK